MSDDAVKNREKQRDRPFRPGVSGNAGGRPRGSKNKRTQLQADVAAAQGVSPLDFLLSVMRDPTAQVVVFDGSRSRTPVVDFYKIGSRKFSRTILATPKTIYDPFCDMVLPCRITL